MPSSDRLHHRQ